MARTVAVVLANEPGSGFTGSKYLGTIGGTTLIDGVLADVSDWPVDDTVVVLGPDAEDILLAMAPADATVVIDLEWREGTAASLRVGLDVVLRGPATDLVVIAPADQLGIGAEDGVVRGDERRFCAIVQVQDCVIDVHPQPRDCPERHVEAGVLNSLGVGHAGGHELGEDGVGRASHVL